MSEAFDEDRELCADGNCLGVIVDGQCNVCALAADGRPPLDPAAPQAETLDPPGRMLKVSDDEFDDQERALCPDGACTGLLGTDGKCKECGRSAAS